MNKYLALALAHVIHLKYTIIVAHFHIVYHFIKIKIYCAKIQSLTRLLMESGFTLPFYKIATLPHNI
jgi:hypothetical protein